MLKKICITCKKTFYKTPNVSVRIWEKNTKCCSRACANVWRKGRYLGGKRFEKGLVPWNKGIKRVDILGEKHPNFKGGTTVKGYKRIYAPFHPSKDSHNYVAEHRLVMEKSIGRYLRKDEIVHHINHDKKDNRIENLKIMNRSEHMTFHDRERGRDIHNRFKKLH